jgi:hypothetical protein
LITLRIPVFSVLLAHPVNMISIPFQLTQIHNHTHSEKKSVYFPMFAVTSIGIGTGTGYMLTFAQTAPYIPPLAWTTAGFFSFQPFFSLLQAMSEK